jgi:hypothetical protein
MYIDGCWTRGSTRCTEGWTWSCGVNGRGPPGRSEVKEHTQQQPKPGAVKSWGTSVCAAPHAHQTRSRTARAAASVQWSGSWGGELGGGGAEGGRGSPTTCAREVVRVYTLPKTCGEIWCARQNSIFENGVCLVSARCLVFLQCAYTVTAA